METRIGQSQRVAGADHQHPDGDTRRREHCHMHMPRARFDDCGGYMSRLPHPPAEPNRSDPYGSDREGSGISRAGPLRQLPPPPPRSRPKPLLLLRPGASPKPPPRSPNPTRRRSPDGHEFRQTVGYCKDQSASNGVGRGSRGRKTSNQPNCCCVCVWGGAVQCSAEPRETLNIGGNNVDGRGTVWPKFDPG